MLEEAKLATRADHAVELAECDRLIGDRAEHQASNPSVERAVLGGQCVGGAGDDPDRHGRLDRVLLGESAHVVLGLDREDLGDARRVVLEVRAVASAKLDHPPGQAIEQPPAVLVLALGLRLGAQPRVQEPREQRMLTRPVR